MEIQPVPSSPTVTDVARARAQLGPIGQRRLDYAVHRTYLAAEHVETSPDSRDARMHLSVCAADVARLTAEHVQPQAASGAVA